MNESIGFFGTSVTLQKNGYTHFLSEKLNTKNITYGYGSCHIDDAGICCIDNVLLENLTYCFIDFFSTGYTLINDSTLEYIDTINYKFTKNSCKMIFLFFPRIDHCKRNNFYDFVKKYLEDKKLFYIDINDHLEYSSEFCRDIVHTTETGSRKYAEIIYDIFQKEKENISLPVDIVKTKFCDIKKLDVNHIFKDNLILEGDCKIIAFYLVIGPKSGIIKINDKKYNLWDEYCHYERKNFKLNNILINNKIDLEVSQEMIDYSSCRRDYDFSNIIKELNIITIYYTGNELKIV
jgi:hypothetical protein